MCSVRNSVQYEGQFLIYGAVCSMKSSIQFVGQCIVCREVYCMLDSLDLNRNKIRSCPGNLYEFACSILTATKCTVIDILVQCFYSAGLYWLL